MQKTELSTATTAPERLQPSEALRRRILRRIVVTDGCWIWQGGKGSKGYGQISIGGFTKKVHRVMFEINIRALNPGEFACHHCDNPPCCNPDHLFAGSAFDNNEDMRKKGRMRRACGDLSGARLHPERVPRGMSNGAYTKPERRRKGENHGMSKLTVGDVIEIRSRCARGEIQRIVALSFGITKDNVSKVVLRKSWAHVP